MRRTSRHEILESLLFVQRELASGKLILPLGLGGLTVHAHSMMILKANSAVRPS